MTIIEQYIIVATSIIIALGSLVGALIALKSKIKKFFKGLFKRKTPNSIQCMISNHQLNNIANELIEVAKQIKIIETKIEEIPNKKEQIQIDSINEQLEVMQEPFNMALTEILIVVDAYIDTMPDTVYNLTIKQMKNISSNAIILALLTTKNLALDRIKKDKFEDIKDWTIFINKQEDHLYREFKKDFFNRTSIEHFIDNYKTIIIEVEKIVKRYIEIGFNDVKIVFNKMLSNIEKKEKEKKELEKEKEELLKKQKEIIENTINQNIK